MVDRDKLPDRRPSLTVSVDVEMDKSVQRVLLTIGFGPNGRAREMFCASFRAGTGLNVLVMDACVLVSLLLQHGYTARDIFETLADGPSMIGQLVREVVLIEEGGDRVVRTTRKSEEDRQ